MANSSDVLLYENPFYGESAVSNPHRRKHHRRNPNILSKVTQPFLGGLMIEQVFGAIAGFGLAAFIPNKILPLQTGTTTIVNPDSTLKKVGRVGIALALGAVAKFALKSRPALANSIMYGSVAGAAAIAYKQWAPTTWVQPMARIGGMSAPAAAPMPRYNAPAPSNNLGGQTASDFIPSNQL